MSLTAVGLVVIAAVGLMYDGEDSDSANLARWSSPSADPVWYIPLPTPTPSPAPSPTPSPVSVVSPNPTPQSTVPPVVAEQPPPSGPEAIICAPVYAWDCATAMRIASCETGGTFDPHAVGKAGERGWFQIHPTHFWRFDSEMLFDPAYNTWAAYQMWSEQGWWPWTCY